MTKLNYKELLLSCAQKMEELSELLEPLFKSGHENFAPNTDWWSIIAGDRHCNLSDIRMYRGFASQMRDDGMATDLEGNVLGEATSLSECWRRGQLEQRARYISESEKDSPCQNGCLLTWNKQHNKESEIARYREALEEIIQPPYADSDHTSLLKWCNARARAVLDE